MLLAHALRREVDREGGPLSEVVLALPREFEARRRVRAPNVLDLRASDLVAQEETGNYVDLGPNGLSA